MLLGVDFCSNKRIEQALKTTESFQEEVFSRQEIEYCQAQRKLWPHYGARWAAKEAFVKAIAESILGCELPSLKLCISPADSLVLK